MERLRLWFALAGTALAFAVVSPPAAAATVTYDFNVEFSGGEAPAGPTPWIVATFSDTSIAGVVQLTITTSGLTGNESIAALYFNLDPTLSATHLAFTSLNSGAGSIAASSIQTGTKAFMADGDGLYDILMSYPTGSGPGTFNNTVSSTYDITYKGNGTLTAASFFFLSAPAGGHGPYYAAAHVQNTTGPGSGGSGWIAPVSAVPLPASVWLLLSGFGSLVGVRWLSRQRAAAPALRHV